VERLMAGLNGESLCTHCRRRPPRTVEGYGEINGCVGANMLETDCQLTKCDVTVTACERFELAREEVKSEAG